MGRRFLRPRPGDSPGGSTTRRRSGCGVERNEWGEVPLAARLPCGRRRGASLLGGRSSSAGARCALCSRAGGAGNLLPRRGSRRIRVWQQRIELEFFRMLQMLMSQSLSIDVAHVFSTCSVVFHVMLHQCSCHVVIGRLHDVVVCLHVAIGPNMLHPCSYVASGPLECFKITSK
jgi:hypothetical protein